MTAVTATGFRAPFTFIRSKFLHDTPPLHSALAQLLHPLAQRTLNHRTHAVPTHRIRSPATFLSSIPLAVETPHRLCPSTLEELALSAPFVSQSQDSLAVGPWC